MRRLRVKEEAMAKGFTIARLERTAGIDIKTVRSIWHNPRHNASFETLEKIAAAINVPVTDLIEDDTPATQDQSTATRQELTEISRQLLELDHLLRRKQRTYVSADQKQETAQSTLKDAPSDEVQQAKNVLEALLPNDLQLIYIQEYRTYGIFAKDVQPKTVK